MRTVAARVCTINCKIKLLRARATVIFVRQKMLETGCVERIITDGEFSFQEAVFDNKRVLRKRIARSEDRQKGDLDKFVVHSNVYSK